MYKLIYVVVFRLLAVLDWHTVRRRVNAVVYFGIFAVAVTLALLSVWFVQDFSLARLFS